MAFNGRERFAFIAGDSDRVTDDPVHIGHSSGPLVSEALDPSH